MIQLLVLREERGEPVRNHWAGSANLLEILFTEVWTSPNHRTNTYNDTKVLWDRIVDCTGGSPSPLCRGGCSR